MKLKHNKKRNTAFLYEALIKELTKSIINKEDSKKNVIAGIIKENFKKSSILGQELQLYKTLEETENVDLYTAERLVSETKTAHSKIDKSQIYEKQSVLIKRINKEITSGVFSNFVPNYKSLATISQIFNDTLTPKERVLLERSLISVMAKPQALPPSRNLPHLDKLTYKKLIEGFNEKYGAELLKEQSELLKNYLVAFSDNGLALKIYLNEEIGRLKQKTSEMSQLSEISLDPNMSSQTDRILERLNSFKKGVSIDGEMIEFVLKTQKLVSEVFADVD